ncbi:MAG TPA: flagellar protein FlbB [Rhodospirillaceae bacterium]|nr:flagellar protein FlbB [Rhodospirillaceae bacterium]
MLVLVAMMAFSFRIVEIATGFSNLSGAALAVEEVDAQPPEMPTEAKSAPADESAKGEHAPEDPAKPAMKDSSMVGVSGDSAEEKKAEEKPQLTFAEEEKDKKEDEHKKDEEHKDEKPTDWQDAGDSDLDYTEVRMELFEDLSKRRKEIEKQEQEMLTREALLRAAEKELDRKFQEMTQLRSEIESLLEKQSQEEESRVQSLVKIYEGMKPKDAARIFNTLDLDILVAVMGKMSERKLSPILANMNEERARTITIMLAEQKKLPSLADSN